jgi:hypothetical protein
MPATIPQNVPQSTGMRMISNADEPIGEPPRYRVRFRSPATGLEASGVPIGRRWVPLQSVYQSEKLADSPGISRAPATFSRILVLGATATSSWPCGQAGCSPAANRPVPSLACRVCMGSLTPRYERGAGCRGHVFVAIRPSRRPRARQHVLPGVVVEHESTSNPVVIGQQTPNGVGEMSSNAGRAVPTRGALFPATSHAVSPAALPPPRTPSP